MAYKIDRVDIWIGSMTDKPGALAKKLAPLAEAGAELEFVLARRDAKGRGLVFLAPLKGAKQAAAAKKARVKKSPRIVALRLEGPDKVGLASAVAVAVAVALALPLVEPLAFAVTTAFAAALTVILPLFCTLLSPSPSITPVATEFVVPVAMATPLPLLP